MEDHRTPVEATLRPIRVTLVASAVLMLLVPLKASVAQEIASLKTGDRLRLTVASPPSHRIEGTLASLSFDGLVLTGAPDSAPISFSSIRTLEVRRHTRGSFIGSVGRGLLVGVVGGAVVGAARGKIDTGDGTITAGEDALISSIVGGVAGLLGGAIYGACCSSSWQPLAIPRR